MTRPSDWMSSSLGIFLSLRIAVFTAARAVAGPQLAMQERDCGNAVCSLPLLPVSILLAWRVAATPLPPVGGGMRRGPRCAASGRRRAGLSRKRSVVGRRNGHADQLLDVAQVRRLFAVAERDRDACCPGSRGAADAVYIGFWHVRQIEIHDVADAVDIDTARCNVGGDQREHFPLFFFSSRRRHTRFSRDWSSDVCSSD